MMMTIMMMYGMVVAVSECNHDWQNTNRGTIYLECSICHEPFNAERVIDTLQIKIEQLMQIIDSQKSVEEGKYAILGRLAMTVNVGCKRFDNFICKKINDNYGCSDYNFCNKRAELLAGEK